MIDVSNLKDALETLGFVAHGDIHEKVFPEIGQDSQKYSDFLRFPACPL